MGLSIKLTIIDAFGGKFKKKGDVPYGHTFSRLLFWMSFLSSVKFVDFQ